MDDVSVCMYRNQTWYWCGTELYSMIGATLRMSVHTLTGYHPVIMPHVALLIYTANGGNFRGGFIFIVLLIHTMCKIKTIVKCDLM